MEATTLSRRCWFFYIVMCMAAYCFMFDSVVHAEWAETTVRIDFPGGHGFNMRYGYNTDYPDIIESYGRFGATGLMGTTGYGEVVDFLFTDGKFWSDFNGVEITGSQRNYTASVLRTPNPQTVRWTGPAGVLTATFDWPDLSPSQKMITATVHLTVKNPAWRSAQYGIDSLSYNALRQTTTTHDVQVTVPENSVISFVSDSDWVFESDYDPMFVTSASNEFTRVVRMFPQVQVGKYKIRFSFLNYATSDLTLKIGSGTIGGTTWLGEFTAKAAPATGEATTTSIDILVDLPSDFDGFVFDAGTGHVVKQFAPDHYPLSTTSLNLFFRAIDLPNDFIPPSAGVSGNSSTVVVPPQGTPPAGGSVQDGGIFDASNTDTSNLTNAFNQVIPGPAGPAGAQGPAGMSASDNAVLKSIEDHTNDVSKSMRAVDKYFDQDPDSVVNTTRDLVEAAVKPGADEIARQIAVSSGQYATLKDGFGALSAPTPMVMSVPWLNRTLELDINPFTNTWASSFTNPLALFVKSVIAFGVLLFTWRFCLSEIKWFLEFVNHTPNYIPSSVALGGGTSPLQAVLGGLVNLVKGVGFRIAVCSLIVMLIPAGIAIVESGMGSTLLSLVGSMLDYLTSAKQIAGSSQKVWQVLVMSAQIIPYATIFVCIAWRLFVVQGFLMFAPFASMIVRFVNP